MKLIVDTDGGIDDAVALLMATAYPAVDLLAITTVMGNVSLAQATNNIKLVLDSVDAPYIPLYRGCVNPLLQYSPVDATDVHGADGLGNATGRRSDRGGETEHASLALNRIVTDQPGQVTLLTLGPLTNLALTIRLNPLFLDNLAHLVIMGGSVDGRGNTTAAAEFNIYVDPESAAIVFDACHDKNITVTLLSWEATLSHPVPLATWEAMISGDSRVKSLLQQMTTFFKQLWWGNDIVLWPDPLAAAVALEPDIVEFAELRHLAVNIDSGLSRGDTIIDYRLNQQLRQFTRIVRRVNQPRFEQILQMAADQ